MFNFHKMQTREDGYRYINVDYKGRPFAQLWTWKKQNETHPWHAKLACGEEYKCFYSDEGGLEAAKDWLRKKIKESL